jgi:penicillin G amidase
MRFFSHVSLLLLPCLVLACSGDDPDYSFPGISDDVEVLLDDRGVPHIYAANDRDLMYAAGFQMAVDRLFPMDLMRRRALGRRAEVLGESVLGDDQLLRRVNIRELARQDLDAITRADPDLRRMLEAWVAGVNTRVAQVLAGEVALPYGFGPGELDYAPELWTVEEAMAVPKLILFGNGSNLQFDILATVLDNLSPTFMGAVELPRPAFPAFTMPPELRPASGMAAALTDGARAPLPSDEPAPVLDEAALRGLRRLLEMPGGFGPTGSNNWAIAGERTENGRPLIAGDPHQPLQSPSVFYVHHLNSKDRGGTIDAAGWSFVGAPLVHIGRTPTVVWTATTNFADQMDVFSVVPVTDSGSGALRAVRIGDQEARVESRTETFEVRQFDADGVPLPVSQSTETTLTMYDVPGQGILLSLMEDMGIPDALVARPVSNRLLFRWVGFRGTTEAATWLGYNRAESIGDVEESLDAHSSLASFNWIAADAEDITYRVRMDIPDRSPTAETLPTRVLDATRPGAIWTGQMLTPDKLPAARNPARGYLASANNDPWGFTADGDITNDPWYYGGFYAAGFRANRIHDELDRILADGPVTAAQMRELQLDVHSQLADAWVPLLTDAIAQVGVDTALDAYIDREDLVTLAAVITAWDRRFTQDSPGALAFYLYAMSLGSEILQEHLAGFLGLIMNADAPFTLKFAMLALSGEYPMSNVIVGGNPHGHAMAALDRAATWLDTHFGGVNPAVTPYTYGEAHGTVFDMAWSDAARNDLILGFVPTRGGIDSVNPSVATFYRDDAGTQVRERFDSRSGPLYRMVATFREDGRAEMSVNWPAGNVADPLSPHFDDTLDDWALGNYWLFPFDRSEVEAARQNTVVLPAGTGAP